jgi:hypothetical protein
METNSSSATELKTSLFPASQYKSVVATGAVRKFAMQVGHLNASEQYATE